MLLNTAYGIGDVAVPAPQATLMKLIVEGIMTAQLPWTLVMIGVALAAFCALANIPILAVALGIYLPIGLNAAVFSGGIVRELVERSARMTAAADEAKTEARIKAAASGTPEGMGIVAVDQHKPVEKGILLASGLVAGDALMGIVIGACVALGIDIGFGLKLFPVLSANPLLAAVMFLLLAVWIYVYSLRRAPTK